MNRPRDALLRRPVTRLVDEADGDAAVSAEQDPAILVASIASTHLSDDCASVEHDRPRRQFSPLRHVDYSPGEPAVVAPQE